MTTPISPAGSNSVPIGDASTTTSAQGTGMASLLQPDTFLNLLVDELKYQNPLNPTDSSTFMSQIAELSQVEQLEDVSSSSQISEAADLIGKSVTADDASGASITGIVTGVTNGSNGPTLDVDGDAVALSDVDQIGDASS